MLETEMEERTKMNDNELTLTDILLYIKRFFVKIMTRGIITIAIILAVTVLAWLLLPYDMRYCTELENTLQKTNGHTYIYPNGRAFNTLDVISPAVLHDVYNHMKLEDKIPYTEFVSLFYIDNSSMKQARLDAEYETKLSKKNLSTVSLNLLEKEYNLKRTQIANDIFRINMKTHYSLSKGDCIQALTLVPETWYKIYSKTEAATLPKVELDAWKKDFAESMKAKEGNLVVLEKARIYCNLLKVSCDSLQRMLDGKNIALDSGEFLEDIRRKLEHIQKFQISVFSQFIIMSSALFTQYDQIYLLRSLKTTDRELMKVDENIFTYIYDAHDMEYIFKYRRECFEKFLQTFNLKAQDCVMFEDSIKNLETAKACGMITVYIKPNQINKPEFVDYMFPDIKTALKNMFSL